MSNAGCTSMNLLSEIITDTAVSGERRGWKVPWIEMRAGSRDWMSSFEVRKRWDTHRGCALSRKEE
jgi:hypothetical protein